MIGLLQRVTNARVEVDGHTVGEIGRGLLVLVAVHRDDGERDVARLAERILSYRVFPDDDGRMNRSVVDEGGGLLLVPQFTLAADTKKGTRASFTRAAAPEKGEAFFRQLVRPIRDIRTVLLRFHRYHEHNARPALTGPSRGLGGSAPGVSDVCQH
jgi:D-tyrosyl-tRNA(Tyr) deacylase